MGVAKRTRKFATARDLYNPPSHLTSHTHHHDLTPPWADGHMCVNDENDDVLDTL